MFAQAGPRLPLFCYNIEIQHSSLLALGPASRDGNVLRAVSGITGKLFQQRERTREDEVSEAVDPIHYTIGTCDVICRFESSTDHSD
jgi:hypothetical protein